MDYREKAFAFGAGSHLAGIMTMPKDGVSTDKPMIIMLSAGLIHRVGPFRLHVRLARKFASDGFSVFRMDLSGIGDSTNGPQDSSLEKQVVHDVKSALDLLQQRYGFKKFVLLGLCAGAQNAHRVAVLDNRVCGCVMLDGFVFLTPKYYLKHYFPRLVDGKKWIKLMHKALISAGLMKSVESVTEDHERKPNDVWRVPTPPKKQIADELAALVKREVYLLYIYTGGSYYYIYKNQLKDAFPMVKFKDRLTLEYLESADHTYVRNEDRQLLGDRILHWLNSIKL